MRPGRSLSSWRTDADDTCNSDIDAGDTCNSDIDAGDTCNSDVQRSQAIEGAVPNSECSYVTAMAAGSVTRL